MSAPENQPPERSTLSDVAALAGVSAKTASRALNGHPGVSPETRERVENAAVKLRFRPNLLAKELRTGATTRAVGLVVADISNPFFSQLAAAVEAELHDRGLELILGSTAENAEREREVVRSLLERRVRALLMVPASEDQRYLQFERAMGTPMVFLDRPAAGLSVDEVLGDNQGAARRVVDALIAAGHERIAILGDTQDAWTARQRLAGAREALAAAGRDPQGPLVREGAHTPELAADLMADLLAEPEPPTAVFALNNLSTLGALRALRRRGAELTVVGFDDSDAAELLDVSVIRLDPATLGQRAARIALARLDGDDRPPATDVLPTELVVRTPLAEPVRLAPARRT